MKNNSCSINLITYSLFTNINNKFIYVVPKKKVVPLLKDEI